MAFAPILRRFAGPARRYASSSSQGPIKSQAPSTAPQISADMLYRRPNRPLPTLKSLNPNRRWLRTFPVFVAILTVSALGIFNYQRVNSPVITATMYSLRTNPRVREALGDEVYFGSRWAWVHGEINLVQGRIDVWFSVKGTKKSGICRFRAKRMGGRSGSFQTLEWSLKPDDSEEAMQLLEDQGDPLTGAPY